MSRGVVVMINRYCQISFGQRLAEFINFIIHHAGAVEEFKLLTYPNTELYVIKVFLLDFCGRQIYPNSYDRGYEIFRVEIKLPDDFFLFSFDHFGLCTKSQRLKYEDCVNWGQETEDFLIRVLCDEKMKPI